MNSILDTLDSITDAQKYVLCTRYLSNRFGNFDVDGSWCIEDGVVVIKEARKIPGSDSCCHITHRIMPNGTIETVY